MDSRIILPLDHLPYDRALEIIRLTSGRVWGYKLRRSVLEQGLSVIAKVKRYGRVMLDFKLYDIPSAMTESLKLHLEAGADITTVHCTSGYDPQSAGLAKSGIAGVSILTSMHPEQFSTYYRGDSIPAMVTRMAAEAETRYEYLVCSPEELKQIARINIKKICPGIRPQWYQTSDDQTRTATPAEAVSNGADLLVIGRPILTASSINEALDRTNAEVEAAA